MTEDELSKVADLVFQKLETKFHALDGVVGARGRRGEDGRQGPQGIPGKDASDGKEGKQGSSTRLVIIYKVTDTNKAPAAPNGGEWDFMTNKFTAPEGWSVDAPNNDNGYIWQSQAVFSSTGGQIQAWTQPFRLNAKDGGAGADSYTIEYVYKLTTGTTDIPDVPDNDCDTDDYTGNWEDNPQGISEEMKAEWVCSRLRQEDGRWGDWIGPTLWSVWGSAGKDGDGVQYVFKRTTENKAPDTITGNSDNENPNEFIPESEGWTDDPMGVDEENPFEWVSQRKFDGVNKVWKEWSQPKLWASWGKKGDTGLSAKFMFQDCIEGVDAPPIENHKDSPGEQWTDLVPYPLEPDHVIWACQALVDGDGHVYCDKLLPEEKQGWQGPWIITGADGEKGDKGNEPDYTTIVFQQSDLMPEKPNGDAKTPGNGWSTSVPVETSTTGNVAKHWWGCWGNVTHVDNPEYKKKTAADRIKEELSELETPDIPMQITTTIWGSPLPLDGNFGSPVILWAGQLTNTQQDTVYKYDNGAAIKAIGVDKLSIAYGEGGRAMTVTVQPSVGYTIKVYSATGNAGATGDLDETKMSSGKYHKGEQHNGHTLLQIIVDDNNKIVVGGFSPRNSGGNGAFWQDLNWTIHSLTLVIFGTVTRNISKANK